MRSFYSGLLAVAFCISAPVLLTSCGDDDDVTVRRPAVHLSAHVVMPYEIDDLRLTLPASFTVNQPSIADVMAPEAVKTIDRLKPEYEEALATDALNFTEVRRRT
ncbi:hypothetical protein [Pararhizobium gei]|uniref:hypothetical protein n=1 Tax=Pararhizobium gei TaxID=1395951 RepID=UPI0023DC90A0|nr:hypothetical protein [Rhizobium gei]